MEEKRGLFHRGHIALAVALAAMVWSLRLRGTSLGDRVLQFIGVDSVRYISIGAKRRKIDVTMLVSLVFLVPALVLAHNSDDSKCGAIAKTICLIMLSAIFVMLLNLSAEGLRVLLR